MFHYTAGPYRVWSFRLGAEEISPLELFTKSISLWWCWTYLQRWRQKARMGKPRELITFIIPFWGRVDGHRKTEGSALQTTPSRLSSSGTGTFARGE